MILKDPMRIKRDILENVLLSSSKQLEESIENMEQVKSIWNSAKNPKERTAINIILDDQRKVIKALERLIADTEEIIV